MISFRPVLLTLPLAAAAGIAALSLAACSAGSTNVPASPGPTAPVAEGSTVRLPGPPGGFPVPHGAGVLGSAITSDGYAIILGNVTARAADSFYSAALPADGYTISQHDSASGNGFSGTGFAFTGHGYKGEIATITGPGISGLPSFAGMPSFPSMRGFPSMPSASGGAAGEVTLMIALVRQ